MNKPDKSVKDDFVLTISQKNKCSKTLVKKIVNDLFDEMKTSLSQGNNIELRGFGTFEIKHRQGRKNSINPKTMEKVKSEEHSVVVFRPGSDIKEKVYKVKGK